MRTRDTTCESARPTVGPRLAGVGGLVDAVALHDVAAQGDLPHPDEHDVGVRLRDGDGADRRTSDLAVGHGLPRGRRRPWSSRARRRPPRSSPRTGGPATRPPPASVRHGSGRCCATSRPRTRRPAPRVRRRPRSRACEGLAGSLARSMRPDAAQREGGWRTAGPGERDGKAQRCGHLSSPENAHRASAGPARLGGTGSGRPTRRASDSPSTPETPRSRRVAAKGGPRAMPRASDLCDTAPDGRSRGPAVPDIQRIDASLLRIQPARRRPARGPARPRRAVDGAGHQPTRRRAHAARREGPGRRGADVAAAVRRPVAPVGGCGPGAGRSPSASWAAAQVVSEQNFALGALAVAHASSRSRRPRRTSARCCVPSTSRWRTLCAAQRAELTRLLAPLRADVATARSRRNCGTSSRTADCCSRAACGSGCSPRPARAVGSGRPADGTGERPQGLARDTGTGLGEPDGVEPHRPLTRRRSLHRTNDPRPCRRTSAPSRTRCSDVRWNW